MEGRKAKVSRYQSELKKGCAEGTKKKLTKGQVGYRRGFLNGATTVVLNTATQAPKVTVKPSIPAVITNHYDYTLAKRYANHMGSRCNLSKADIEKNALKHYNDMHKDKDFKRYLEREYGN